MSVSLFCIWHGLACAAGTQPAPAQERIRCETKPSLGDIREVSCPLTASGNAQRFRFKANFSGGHDDTRAAMSATLKGAPLACDAGSKTSLFGEDGDVSLECRFSMTEKAGTELVLRMTIRWSHAQYTDFEFGAE
jgi:hypothetical protein